jgi:hypothetical protein
MVDLTLIQITLAAIALRLFFMNSSVNARIRALNSNLLKLTQIQQEIYKTLLDVQLSIKKLNNERTSTAQPPPLPSTSKPEMYMVFDGISEKGPYAFSVIQNLGPQSNVTHYRPVNSSTWTEVK